MDYWKVGVCFVALATAWPASGRDITESEYRLAWKIAVKELDSETLGHLRDQTVVFVRGFLSDLKSQEEPTRIVIDDLGVYFGDSMEELSRLRIDYRVADINGEGSPEENAERIWRSIATVSRPILFVTHSKGGIDLLTMLLKRTTEERKKFAGWLTIQSAFEGTPVADAILESPVLAPAAVWILEQVGGSRKALESLTTSERTAFLDSQAQPIAELLDDISTIAVATYREDKPWRRDTLFEPLRDWMEKKGIRNDGLVPTESSILPGADYILLPDLDHAATIRETRYIRFDRPRFLRALLTVMTNRRATSLDIQGHRGARGLLPENSMVGFQKAIEIGVTTLELDLHVTRDRVVIVEHDASPDPLRCVRDDGSAVPSIPFSNLNYAEVKTFDCGRLPQPRFPNQQRVPGTRIPRFDEVLALAKSAPYPVRLNAEIKYENPEISIPAQEFAERVVNAVRSFGLEDRTTIQSFSAEVLKIVGELAPHSSRAMLAEHRKDFDRLMAESGANILSVDYKELSPEIVRRYHDRHIPVIPWTVNDPGDIRKLIGWHVDGMISDYPDRVIAIWNEARP